MARILTERCLAILLVFQASDIPISALEIKQYLPISVYSVRSAIRTMLKHREVHTAGYRRELRHITPLYMFGNGVEAEKPKPYTRIDVTRRYRENHPDKTNEMQRVRHRRVKIERMQKLDKMIEIFKSTEGSHDEHNA